MATLDTLDGHGSLRLELLLVPVLLLLLAVLKAGAVVRLEHAVLPAEMALAETAVADNALGGVLALLEIAADLLGCTATEGQGKVQGALAGDVTVEQRLRGRKVLAGVDEAELGFGHVGAQGEEGTESADGG